MSKNRTGRVIQYLIGVDIGSSDCKTIIIDELGTVIARQSKPYPTRYPRPGWAEQDPEDWYQVACQTVHACMDMAGIDPHAVACLAVDGPAHNVALLDETGKVLYPVIHWSDLRSVPQAARIEAMDGDRVFQITYSRVNPSWTLTQLLWLKENEPQVWSRLRRIMVTKDYVRYRFTGLYQTDVYDAIGTQLYDVAGDCWSAELAALLPFDPQCFPEVLPAAAISGSLLPDAAHDTGLATGTLVAVGSGDSVVEAFGIGAIGPGQGTVKLGTAANVNLVTAHPYPSNQSITYRHVVPERWLSIAATNSGTSTMRWFRDTFCRLEVQQAKEQNLSVYDLIDQLAAGAPAGAEGLLFHPYLMGERSPHWNPYLRGSFVGINTSHTMHHFARAILDGVAFSIRDCLQVVEKFDQPIDTLYLIGGGAKSHLWRQILCDVLGRSLIKPAIEDAAFGSALIAGVAIGVFSDWEEAVSTCVRADDVLHPQPDVHALYDELFVIYKQITEALTTSNHRLVTLTQHTTYRDGAK